MINPTTLKDQSERKKLPFFVVFRKVHKNGAFFIFTVNSESLLFLR
jgi:hypothetical protein